MLLKKLLRTIKLYKAQFISMIIMTAIGTGIFLGFNMEWYSLEKDTAQMYESCGFADYRLYSEKGFSQKDLDAILSIEGVDSAARFLNVNTTVQDSGDIIALAVTSDMNVSGFVVTEGEAYDALSADGIWLSDSYAAKNGISVGDSITLTYKSFKLGCTVKGLIKSAEFMICLIDDTQLMPDYNSYGYAYISPARLKKAIIIEFYSQINVRTSLERAEFISLADSALGKTTLVLSKDENVSYAEAQGEINEGKTMGSILPVVFLAIAILTMVTTMNRITAAEKTQAGTLKALGFPDRRIIAHYTGLALIVGAAGCVAGVGIGYLLGWFIMNPNGAMGTYIDMTDWSLHVPAFCWAVMLLIVAFLTFTGYMSVRKMLRGSAAEALRPYTPAAARRMRIEDSAFWKRRLGFAFKWNLRDSLRHKARTCMTLVGTIGCAMLLIASLGMNDTLNAYIDTYFTRNINYQNKINIDAESASLPDALAIAEQYSGDYSSSASVQITDRPVSVDVYHIEYDLLRFTSEDGEITALSDDGAYVCERIARDYGVKAGDSLSFSPYGTDDTYTVSITGVLQSISEAIIMTDAYARAIGYDFSITAVYTRETQISESPHIVNVTGISELIASFDTMTELMNTMVLLLCIAAVVLGMVVLYNLGVMSYTERYREMATLKVLGFRDSRIGGLLIGQNIALTLIGILAGIPAGAGVLSYLMNALASEYEMSVVIGPVAYSVSILLTLGVSLLVSLMIARKNKHINMVEALKVPE